MKQKVLWIGFVLSLIATLLAPGLIPNINFMTFAPFFVLVILYCRLSTILWISFLCGLILDLFSSTKMGLYILNYCFTSFLLYRQKRNFIEEKLINFLMFTGIYSFTATLLQLMIRYIFDKNAVFFHYKYFIDMITMPFLDAVYAYIWFYIPLYLWNLLEKKFKLWMMQKND